MITTIVFIYNTFKKNDTIEKVPHDELKQKLYLTIIF